MSGLRDAWLAVCRDIDYVPVFESAVNILEILIARTDLMELAVEPLVKAVEETRSIEGHDLSGRLFHTLLTDAKFHGAYYTSVPAATLLARLTFHDWPPNVDWSDHEFPASLNVADLACGTGTLLMAVAAEAERRHVEAGGGDAPALHKAMVEQALHGYDVQLSAVHFAATSLAMLNPSIRFDSMNLHVLPIGVVGSAVSLGSLDFLGNQEVPVRHTLGEEFGVERGALQVTRNRPGGEDGHPSGSRFGDYEPAVHPVGRRQPSVRQPSGFRTSATAERIEAPNSSDATFSAPHNAGVGHRRARRALCRGGRAQNSPRRRTPCARAADHGLHRPVVELGKDDLERMPVLDLRRLDPDQVRRLAALHDGIRDAECEPLPAMAECPARRALDDGVAEILALPSLDALRRLIASEPVVSNRRL